MIKFEACPACGHAPVKTVEGEYRTFFLDRKGVRRDLIVPELVFQECSACDEVFLDDEATSRIERARRVAMGRLTAEDLKAWRLSLKKTQKEMSELLGFGLKTYSRWESGAYIPNASADLYMRLVMSSPENLAKLEEIASQSLEGSTSEIEKVFLAPELHDYELSLIKQGDRFADMMAQGIVFAPMNEKVT